ncbi:hypothetical protein [Undibacterium sp.]|uniref:hypothetical protein n=1 Tax=Undibacterium sp. TaxID=1914977 RepID=UPI002C388776|nr:hypothetical protein [Undibacterium sp.]HTD07154.1 hypothetical protein [Undibacterium sp.]
MTLQDKERQRAVPVALYFPSEAKFCTQAKRCPVAFLGAGYGISHLHYSFIARALNSGLTIASVRVKSAPEQKFPEMT